METRGADVVARYDRHAVFVCGYHEPLRSTILPLAKALRAAARPLQPLVVLEDDTMGRMQRACDAADVVWRPFSDRTSRLPRAAAPAQARRSHRSAASDRRAGPRSDRDGALRRVVRFASTLWKLQRQIRLRIALLRQSRAAVLVLLDDRTLTGCRWIRAAQQLAVPVVVVQWAATHRAAVMAALRAAQQDRQPTNGWVSRLERLVANRVPQAVQVLDQRRVWWIPPEVTLAYHLMGAYPKTNPWTFGGGNADVVTVLGAAWKERFAQDGVTARKLVVTGHPEQDDWYRLARRWDDRRSRVIARDLGLAVESRIVTVIAPAMVLREPGGARQHDIPLADLQADLQRVVEAICDQGEPYAAVVKVHPRDRVEPLSALFGRNPGPLRIVGDYPLHRLIAASAAMACQWSTAAMIGQALGVPVLVFDFHGSPSADLWKGVAGLHHAQSVEQFRTMLRRCLADGSGRAEFLAGQSRFVDQYLCLDGRARGRIAALIEQLVDKPPAAPYR
ncbi:MAG: hypothetical protein A2W31_13195 [Planctomycetes bacterium RBG_16_64_10]|nr:MAG: hypothetical protein A2W31_13195 [Planctomycetes bacterium RBG_16_64_10]